LSRHINLAENKTSRHCKMPPKRKPEESATNKDEEDSPGAGSGGEEDRKMRATDPSSKKKSAWTAVEDDILLKAVVEDQQDRDADGNGDDEEDWDEIARAVPNKTPVQCLKRYMSLIRKGGAKGSSEPVIPVPKAEAATAPSPTPAPTPESASAAEAAAASGDDAVDSSEMLTPLAKKPRKDADSSGRWTTEEIDLLKKLVEQYKDSKWPHS
jgi:Myb-like DNA-binding domain